MQKMGVPTIDMWASQTNESFQNIVRCLCNKKHPPLDRSDIIYIYIYI